MQFGSFQNMIGHNTIAGTKIEVGMGATVLCWSDRHAGTVVEWDGKTIVVQADRATRTDRRCMSECQEYAYEPDPNGARYYFRLDKKGGWRELTPDPITGKLRMAPKGSGSGLMLGARASYHDYSF